ncbi:MAG: MFS transporter [Desulfurococcales archaeon]|nr:MFS transporter [Desulfurococcales archaeon]
MRGVPRELLLLSIVSGVSGGLLWSVQAPFLRSLGYSGAEYGLLGGIGVVSGALSTMAAGILSDRFGARKVLTLGVCIYGLSLLLISRGTLPALILGFTLLGASNGFYWTSNKALLARLGDDETLHYNLSYYAAAGSLGGALGSFLGWAPVYVSRVMGWELVDAYRASIRIIALTALIAAPLALRVEEARGGGGTNIMGIVRGIRGPFMRLAVLEMVIGFGAAMSIHNIDYYFALKYGVTSGELGSVFGVQQMVMGLLMLKLPGLSDRLGGPLKVYLLVTLSSIPLLIGMTLTSNYLLASTLYLVRSILMNVATPLFEAFALSLVPRSFRGVASSILSLSWTLPASGGRVVGGYLLDINVELPLRLTALLYTISLTGYAYIGKRLGRL